MEKKINLEEIIQECVGIRPGAKNTTPMDYGECKFVMKYFGEKLLELATENAVLYHKSRYPLGCNKHPINEQSILDTIKQVE